MARLILMFKEKVIDIFPLSSDQGATIGRHHDNRIVIDNLAVSGHHARVDYNGEGAFITDLQSKNGTYVNETKADENSLQHKDSITIGKHMLVLDLLDEINVDDRLSGDGAQSAQPSAMSEASTMFLDTSHGRRMRGEEESSAEPDCAQNDNLLFLSGGDGEMALSQHPVTIGKNSDADIIVGGLWVLLVGSPAATISKQAGSYYLRYSGGLVKPKHNGAGVKGTIKLNHEDIVAVGPVKVQIQLSKQAAVA